ncbi:hypothetical protein EC991_002822 [Linnemannia zychae]|nr:hypothetical protein EC991_002822 [Linnemannia zychae]
MYRRYRVINPAGFMRQDMTSLVYAQWSIRITHEFRTLPGTLFSEANKKIPSLRHPLFIALDGSQAHPPGTKRSSGAIIRHGSTKEDKSEVESRSVLGFRSAQNVELPCVLYFGKGLQLAHGAIKKDAETLDESVAHGHSTVDSTPVPEGSSWKDIDITKPELPVLAKDRLPFREQMEISQSNGRKFTSPVYDIERLFAHHPQGLEVIKSSCLDLLPRGQRPSDDHDSVPMWVGIRGSKATIPVCVGLWKLASM